jgi:hypothetical protein
MKATFRRRFRVTASIVPDKRDSSSIQVSVVNSGLIEHVGFIPKQEAPLIRRACFQVTRAYWRIVAYKGLINDGYLLDDGTTATYGISLLLPPVLRFLV